MSQVGPRTASFRHPPRAALNGRVYAPINGAVRQVRVVVVEDHILVRAGMCALLEAMAGVSVVAQARDGIEALEAVTTTHPDVVLLDLGLPRLDGLGLLARIVPDHPDVRVLVVSMHDEEAYVWEALHAGAAGYLLKDSSPAEFAIAVHSVAAGDPYLSPAVSRWVLSDYVDRGADGTSIKSGQRLSPRQVQIIRLIAQGRTNREIAHELGIGVKTVETHRSELMTRLDIHDVPGLVRYAIRTGLIQADI
jgi:DNA-binding NarL/FixJ family response regulator